MSTTADPATHPAVVPDPETPDATAVAPGTPGLAALLAEIADGARSREREGRAPYDLIDRVRQTRLGALRIPRDEGGAGATNREFFATLIALGAADANVAHILRAHFWFVEQRLVTQDPDVRARWLGEVAGGSIFGNATSEIGGTRAVGEYVFDTTITREGDGYRVDGAKYYSTGSLYADKLAVYGTIVAEDRLAVAILPVDREGVTLEDDWDGIGQRLTGTGTTLLDGPRAADDEVVLLPSKDDEPRPSTEGAFLQLYLTAVIAGVARAVRDDAVALVKGRERTYSHAAADTPAADPQLLQIVGTIASHAFAAEAAVLAAADALDAADASRPGRSDGAVGAAVGGLVDHTPDAALAAQASLLAAQAKVVVDEVVPRLATILFDVGGASATKASHDLDRHWRSVRTLASHNPTVYKARAIGDLVTNGTPFPPIGFF